MLGILAARTGIKVIRSAEEAVFDLYLCQDGADQRVTLRSPFAILCVDGTAANTPGAFATIYDTLRQEDVHERPAVLLQAGSLGELKDQLRRSTLRFASFECFALLDLLVTHPPRTFLTTPSTSVT